MAASSASLLPVGGYPPARRGRLVVWGLLASQPFGGMTWQVLHYVAGLRRLGFDVWYVEDGPWSVFDFDSLDQTDTYDRNIRYLELQMERIGLSDRWVFREPRADGRCYGALDVAGLERLYSEVDAALNLCGAQEQQPRHDAIKCRIYVETDPVRLQVEIAGGDARAIDIASSHDVLFTYAENIGAEDCRIPLVDFTWNRTRPPVIQEWWAGEPIQQQAPFTTITAWTHHTGSDVEWEGAQWRWNKQAQWEAVLELPSRTTQPLELAIGPIDLEPSEHERVTDAGWRLTPGRGLRDPQAYRRYIQQSKGEFTVAKEQYVIPSSGWFSDRSVCYLAAGRPVITQDTGFGRFVPTGEGLFAFSDIEGAAAAIDAVSRDYRRHCVAAEELAVAEFAAETVLEDLLTTAGL